MSSHSLSNDKSSVVDTEVSRVENQVKSENFSDAPAELNAIIKAADAVRAPGSKASETHLSPKSSQHVETDHLLEMIEFTKRLTARKRPVKEIQQSEEILAEETVVVKTISPVNVSESVDNCPCVCHPCEIAITAASDGEISTKSSCQRQCKCKARSTEVLQKLIVEKDSPVVQRSIANGHGLTRDDINLMLNEIEEGLHDHQNENLNAEVKELSNLDLFEALPPVEQRECRCARKLELTKQLSGDVEQTEKQIFEVSSPSEICGADCPCSCHPKAEPTVIKDDNPIIPSEPKCGGSCPVHCCKPTQSELMKKTEVEKATTRALGSENAAIEDFYKISNQTRELTTTEATNSRTSTSSSKEGFVKRLTQSLRRSK